MPTTSPDSLFYPDDASNPDYTQHITDLAASIQAKMTAQEAWTSWTPTFDTVGGSGFTSGGTGGHMSGFYRRSSPGSGAFIYAEFRILLGTGFVLAGASNMVLNLPVAAYNWGGATDACQNSTVGTWTLRDDSTSPIDHFSGTLGIFLNNSGTQAHFGGSPSPGSGASAISKFRIDSNDPMTFAVGDNLVGQLFYRAN